MRDDGTAVAAEDTPAGTPAAQRTTGAPRRRCARPTRTRTTRGKAPSWSRRRSRTSTPRIRAACSVRPTTTRTHRGGLRRIARGSAGGAPGQHTRARREVLHVRGSVRRRTGSGAPTATPTSRRGAARLSGMGLPHRRATARPARTVRLLQPALGPQQWVDATLAQPPRAARRDPAPLRDADAPSRCGCAGNSTARRSTCEAYVDGHADYRAGLPMPQALYQTAAPRAQGHGHHAADRRQRLHRRVDRRRTAG